MHTPQAASAGPVMKPQVRYDHLAMELAGLSRQLEALVCQCTVLDVKAGALLRGHARSAGNAGNPFATFISNLRNDVANLNLEAHRRAADLKQQVEEIRGALDHTLLG